MTARGEGDAMKRMRWIVLGATLLGTGCIALPTERPSPAPAKQVAEVPPPPTVMPEEVNEKNAHAKAEALMRELDYAAQERVVMPVLHPPEK